MSVTSQVLRVHNRVYQGTGGLIGHKVLGVPTLLLTTTGRRSGAKRRLSLVYAEDGADYLVVASNGGSDSPPAWLHNLRANPNVEIQIGRDRQPAVARVVTPPDPEHARMWTVVNQNNKDRYSAYQEKTNRPIPVVALSPVSSA